MRKTKLLLILALQLFTIGAWAEKVDVTFSANGRSVVKTNVELPYTYWCDYSSENAELDQIIKYLYDIECSAFCWEDPAPSSSGDNITAGISGSNNIFITLEEGFRGSATVTGGYMKVISYYDDVLEDWTDDYEDFTFSLTITASPVLTLSEATDNSTTLTTYNGQVAKVTLTRTLQAGGWNTFCVPFDLATPTGWTVKKLTGAEFNGGTLTLTFGNAASIVAGKPYLVKVTSNVENPTFEGVTISNGTTPTTIENVISFVPVMSPTALTLDDKSYLFVKNGNKLTWASSGSSMPGFRAYFHILDSNIANARAFTMSFDDATGITTVLSDEPTKVSGTYTLDGRRIEGQPTQKGVYIVNGKKTIIK